MTILEKARALRPIIEQAAQSLDDKVASTAAELFPRRKQNGELIKAGTRINENGKVLRAAVDLWDTEENKPTNAATLWEELQYKNGYRIIPETITVTSAFAMDELGWWKDKLYKSIINANVYTPDQYSAGWELVE